MKIRLLNDDDFCDEINELLKQLSPNACLLKTVEELRKLPILCLVGEKSGKIIAYGSLSKYYAQSRGWITVLNDIVVHEDERGNGYGDKLMKELLEAAMRHPRTNQVELTSHESRAAAQGLYKKYGFAKVNTTFFCKKIPEK